MARSLVLIVLSNALTFNSDIVLEKSTFEFADEVIKYDLSVHAHSEMAEKSQNKAEIDTDETKIKCEDSIKL